MEKTLSRFFNFGDKKQEAETIEIEAEVEPEVETEEKLREIQVASIVPNRYQPRAVFDEEKINELAATLAQHGLIQPIVVREIGSDSYEIIAGERRWRAAKKLGWDVVTAVVNNLDDSETASIAIIENLQREELTPIEEAVAYEKLLEIHGLTQEGLALQLGISQSTVANKLRLLKLPDVIQQEILRKTITERHARALIPLKKEADMVALTEEVIAKGLNVKQTEERVNKLLSTENEEEKKKPARKIFGRDMRIAVNTIRQSVSMVKDHGIDIVVDEEEEEEFYQITIKLPKKK